MIGSEDFVIIKHATQNWSEIKDFKYFFSLPDAFHATQMQLIGFRTSWNNRKLSFVLLSCFKFRFRSLELADFES